MKKKNLNKQIKVVGNLSPDKPHIWSAVFYRGGVRTVTACDTVQIPFYGGQKMEKRIKAIGFFDNGTGKHQSNTVYSKRKCIPALTTIEGGGTQQIKVLRKWKRKSES